MATLNKIYVSEEIDKKLRVLKIRTGLTPNLIIRYGMIFSLGEDGIPDQSLYGNDQYREFNRYTLTGQWDLFFTALLKERLIDDQLDPNNDFDAQFKAHISRGVHLIYQRLKAIEDLSDIIEHTQKKLALHVDSLEHTISDIVYE